MSGKAAHTARFTSPVAVGSVVTGVSEGTSRKRPYSTVWSGIYEGVRPSEWTGEPVHFFRDGIIGETPQRCFAFPVSQIESAPQQEGEKNPMSARKPESELQFRDHAPHQIPGPVTAGRKTFAVGDPVSGPDRFGQTVTGTIGRLEQLDTKLSAMSVVTYRKTPAVYASVRHADRENLSTLIDVRKLSHRPPAASRV